MVYEHDITILDIYPALVCPYLCSTYLYTSKFKCKTAVVRIVFVQPEPKLFSDIMAIFEIDEGLRERENCYERVYKLKN